MRILGDEHGPGEDRHDLAVRGRDIDAGGGQVARTGHLAGRGGERVAQAYGVWHRGATRSWLAAKIAAKPIAVKWVNIKECWYCTEIPKSAPTQVIVRK